MTELVHDRPLVTRALACGAFALALLALALPFATITSDLRRSEPSGLELALGDASYTGHYVHDAYRGQVELLVAGGETPALVAFVALAAAVAFVWLPWRLGPAAGVAFGALALLALFVFYQRTGASFSFAQSDRRYGYWLTVLALAGATGWSALVLARTPFWWRPDTGGYRDYFASRDGT